MIVENPPRELIIKWGPLAYVDEKERTTILRYSAEQRKKECKRIEKAIAEMKKRKKW